MLFEHHSNQVWYLLEPSEKKKCPKIWELVEELSRPAPSRPRFPYIQAMSETRKHYLFDKMLWIYEKQRFGNKTKLMFWSFDYHLFWPNWVEIDICAFANKGLFDGEIKIFISCLIFVYHNKNACLCGLVVLCL